MHDVCLFPAWVSLTPQTLYHTVREAIAAPQPAASGVITPCERLTLSWAVVTRRLAPGLSPRCIIAAQPLLMAHVMQSTPGPCPRTQRQRRRAATMGAWSRQEPRRGEPGRAEMTTERSADPTDENEAEGHSLKYGHATPQDQ